MSEFLSTKPLQQTRSVDLAIIGADFTGCSAALHAKPAGMEASVLEANTIGLSVNGLEKLLSPRIIFPKL